MLDVYQSVRIVTVGGVDIAVTDHGPVDGTPVLLIHGFPDSARLWENQIPALTEAGYRVIAPDLRGFGSSDAPEKVSDYTMSTIVADMVAVLDETGIDKAHVVGHDWGAAVAWALAYLASDRVESLTVLSVGHPGAFTAAGLAQRQASWYVLLFQFEEIAERWLSDNDWYWLRRWKEAGDDIGHWIADLERPGRLTASLAIYRANMAPESLLDGPGEYPPVDIPVMGVWSSNDVALTEKQMVASADYVAGEWRYERIDGVGHWIPSDAPDTLNALLLDWLGSR